MIRPDRHFVYEIIRIDTGRVYVGVTWNAESRWTAHWGSRNSLSSPLATDLRILGREAFSFGVVAIFASRDDALTYEKDRIRERRAEPGGVYNRTLDPNEWRDHMTPAEAKALADANAEIAALTAAVRELKQITKAIRKTAVHRGGYAMEQRYT